MQSVTTTLSHIYTGGLHRETDDLDVKQHLDEMGIKDSQVQNLSNGNTNNDWKSYKISVSSEQLVRSCARTTGQRAFALGLSSRNERTSPFVNTENNTTQTVIRTGLHVRHTECTNEDDLTYACGTTTTAPEKRTTRVS